MPPQIHATCLPILRPTQPTAAQLRRATHAMNQRWHFKKRVRQRFGLTLTDEDVATLVWRIKEDKPGVVFLAVRQRSSAWRVVWKKGRHVTMVVIYDHRTEQLVTAYPFKKWKWE
ncbi:MAG: hypothetical protein HZA93_24005 [Verrucomicrobia bacterium]|nr:hypothetical protein [Verrucomicrobiota bacterium]